MNIPKLKLSPWPAVAATGVIAAAALAWFLGVGPLVAAHHAKATEAAKLRDAEASKEAATANLAAAKKTHADLTAQVDALAYEPRKASQLNDYLARIVAAATEAGLAVDGVQPDEPRQLDFSDEVPITLAGRGNTAALARWLHQWNADAPDTAVRAMRLNTSPPQSETGETFTFRFEIDLAWMTAPSPRAVAEEPTP